MDIKIAVFASGSGTNAEQLIKHFQSVSDMTVSQVYCNKPDAFVLERAKNLDVSSLVFSRSEFKSEEFLAQLGSVDFIILAGFLWKIPEYLIQAFPDKIINIHPALLPSYGGKGMYGSHVHESVIANKEKQSGITIHLVNENYDEGRTLFQASCDITSEDTPDSLAQKIHQLEHKYFPQIVEDYIREYMSKK
ncbi:phosphoribosylglycinamide formyltransferase [Marinoscillum pacificum]|uniref:phosphoribosylglycinamide formyltransferase n=1 Tax=Marinoscillum pacificum TaxID=392723 RepID=UPI0021581527|nr:phosphoribosylglycinamide formyltransferase [Marinoscillum pacificum]